MSACRECRNCVYGCPLRDGERDLLVCANRPGREGELTCVEPGEQCRNFRARRRQPARGTRPAKDEVRYPLGKGRFAIVDAADYEWLRQHRWSASGKGSKLYACRKSEGRTILMHRAIMRPPPNLVVDHINGNSQNNCRMNLRTCTPQQNAYNVRPSGGTSRFKGVHRRGDVWEARVVRGGKKFRLGPFDNEAAAARAYDRKAAELFGRFAWLNFPQELRRKNAGRRARPRASPANAKGGIVQWIPAFAGMTALPRMWRPAMLLGLCLAAAIRMLWRRDARGNGPPVTDSHIRRVCSGPHFRVDRNSVLHMSLPAPCLRRADRITGTFPDRSAIAYSGRYCTRPIAHGRCRAPPAVV